MFRHLDHAARRQLRLLALLLLSYLLVVVVYVLAAPEFSASASAMAGVGLTRGQMVLANGAMVLVLYGAVGLAGWWLARRLGLPGIAAEGMTWGQWFGGPLALGAVAGLGLVVFDHGMQRWAGAPPIPHPEFPFSLLASYSAAVGEEIIFRLFLFSLWAVVWTQILKWFVPPTRVRVLALAIANVLAALSFAAAHLGTAMALFGLTSPAQLPGATLVELVVLNSVIGLLAGRAFVLQGLVGAVGIHLGADLVWHVVYGWMV